jgi:hypothetical protein
MGVNRLHTHLWTGGGPRAVRQDDTTLLLRRCARCGRDCAQGFDGIYVWQAVHVGVIRIERVAKSVSDRWIAEDCPGKQLESDNDDRLRKQS